MRQMCLYSSLRENPLCCQNVVFVMCPLCGLWLVSRHSRHSRHSPDRTLLFHETATLSKVFLPNALEHLAEETPEQILLDPMGVTPWKVCAQNLA